METTVTNLCQWIMLEYIQSGLFSEISQYVNVHAFVDLVFPLVFAILPISSMSDCLIIYILLRIKFYYVLNFNDTTLVQFCFFNFKCVSSICYNLLKLKN